MGKSINSECVIQILSRAQKHEQVLKFPTHILSAWSSSVSAHKRLDAAWGPHWGNYLFIGFWSGPARWLRRPFSLPAQPRPCPGSSGCFWPLCLQRLRQHIHAGLPWLRACHLSHWSLNFDSCFFGPQEKGAWTPLFTFLWDYRHQNYMYGKTLYKKSWRKTG